MCSSNAGAFDGVRAEIAVTTDSSRPTPGQGSDVSASAAARADFAWGETVERVTTRTSMSLRLATNACIAADPCRYTPTRSSLRTDLVRFRTSLRYGSTDCTRGPYSASI
jgi:hypothetical protein